MFSVERDDRTTGGVGGFGETESERRIADIVKFGIVKEADYSKSPARLRVGIGDESDPEGYILTGWLPMKTGRTDEWNPLRVGEPVTVIAEGGELQNGVVLPGTINSQAHPNVGDRADLWRKRFADGGTLEYDEAAGALAFTGMSSVTLKVGDNASIVIEDGKITLSAGGASYTLDGNHTLDGGQLSHAGKDVGADHKHGQVQTGGGISGVPV